MMSMFEICPKNECSGCGACANKCPQHCISMKYNDEGFPYPTIEKNKCINCNLCKKTCPIINHIAKREKHPLSFAAKNVNDEIRLSSSSGGIFSALSFYVLKKGGVVYGVAFSEDNKSVTHIRVDNINNLFPLLGSKYLQSNSYVTYNNVKKDLEDGIFVLFTGTPCQINGLSFFLGKEYKNLIKVEIICHGVPSQRLWEKYVTYLENKYKTKICKVNFREKRNGWTNYGVLEEGCNYSHFSAPYENPYMIMFLKNYSLRESCYSCKAKTCESLADITIGDFWGINNIIPSFDDDKGSSILLIHTKNGECIVNEIKPFCNIEEVDFYKSIQQNPSYFESAKKPPERNTFFNDAYRMDFDELSKKYCSKKVSFHKRIKKAIKRLLLKN